MAGKKPTEVRFFKVRRKSDGWFSKGGDARYGYCWGTQGKLWAGLGPFRNFLNRNLPTLSDFSNYEVIEYRLAEHTSGNVADFVNESKKIEILSK